LKTRKKTTKKKITPEINFVSGNDLYIYELLLGETTEHQNQVTGNKVINKKQITLIKNKTKIK
jgi:hypothetical protein